MAIVIVAALGACVSQTQSAAAPQPLPTVIATVTVRPSEKDSPSSTTSDDDSPVRSDVLRQPRGRFCWQLRDAGYDFAASVTYWRYRDQPRRMDADHNGIPCQTVYSPADVAAYYGVQWSERVALSPGQMCRDLKAQGLAFSLAVGYWLAEGMPDRMDIDLNGVPCETVYPPFEVAAYYGDRAELPDVGALPTTVTAPVPPTVDLGRRLRVHRHLRRRRDLSCGWAARSVFATRGVS